MTAQESRQLDLRASDDGVELHLDCNLEGVSDLAFTVDLILDKMHGMKIALRIERDELMQNIREAVARSSRLTDFVVVKGVAPGEPVDGRVEWTRDYFSTDFIVDEKTGAVNYRERRGNPNVNEGEVLAKVYPPKGGTSGHDIYDQPIPGLEGKPVEIRPGTNVSMEQEEGCLVFHATTDGRARLERGTLTVDTVYSVNGDVGFETGNIDHRGNVVVSGDVLAGSVIQCTGDLEVHGLVEPCSIAIDGNLVVRGGITGESECPITVGGNVHARFLQDVRLEARGDVEVETGIINCQIKSKGRVAIPRGRFAGGKATALRGITVGDAGSAGLVPTRLIAAVDFELERILPKRKAMLTELVEKAADIHRRIDPLLRHAHEMGEKQRLAVAQLFKMAIEIEERCEEFRAEMDEMIAHSKKHALGVISVQGHLYPEARLIIEKLELHVTEALEGPLYAKIVKDKVKLRGGVYDASVPDEEDEEEAEEQGSDEQRNHEGNGRGDTEDEQMEEIAASVVPDEEQEPTPATQEMHEDGTPKF